MTKVIALVPIYLAERPGDRLLGPLARQLGEVFETAVEMHPPWFDPESSFDPSRGQYNSTLLLDRLEKAPCEAVRVLGVAGVDLFIPVLSYVFGEAQLPGRAAVISLVRLAPELYGLPPDEARLAGRTEKEAIHELGHTFGLAHCRQPRCVMGSSTYVEEIDLKSARFCQECLGTVRRSGAEARRAALLPDSVVKEQALATARIR
jgi:archaemetzincin